MSEKPKNKENLLSPINFVLLWICLSVATTYFVAASFHWLSSLQGIGQLLSNLGIWQFVLLSKLFVGGGVAIVQKQVLRLAFGRSFNGWIRASIIGAILSALPFLYIQNAIQPMQYNSIGILSDILRILPFIWILRSYSKWSWSLLLSTTIGTIIGHLLLSSYQSDFASLSIAGIRFALVAFNLLWLFRGLYQPQAAKKEDENRDYKHLEDQIEPSLTDEEIFLAEAGAKS